jgi:RNA polymerase sigma factor (sigma-70 family)
MAGSKTTLMDGASTPTTAPSSASSVAEGSTTVGELMARYGTAIRHFFARRVHSASDADDLTQRVFERMINRADLGQIGNPQGYLFQVAANLLAERARADARRRSFLEEGVPADAPEPAEELTPERILLGKEACERILVALRELPTRVRAVFVLARFEELKAPEIANRLGVSISTVEKDMRRAVAHLRDAIR